MLFRKALSADMGRIMEIIRQAQTRMRAAGSAQWQDGYPARSDIEVDIACGRGLVACIPSGHKEAATPSPVEGPAPRPHIPRRSAEDPIDGARRLSEQTESESRIVGYAAVLFDGEPAYEALEGSWHGGPHYGAVHRLAVADEALHKGVGKALLREAMRMTRMRGLRSFRIDTARENRPMRSLLAALGFAYRGTVHYASGERMAFEKLLNDETR